MDSKMNTIYDCSIINFRQIRDRAGNITTVESSKHIPFDIKRVFYLYDIPGGESRGAHAHKVCHQLLIAAGGSFSVTLDDGVNKKTVSLDRPYYGLHIVPGIWAAEENFSSGAICLVLTSDFFDESDYIRDYQIFLGFKND
jgi:hypothetical protein